MERVKLTLEVEPELRRRIKLSATARDGSLREWVHRALLRELEADSGAGHELIEERLTLPPAGAKPKGSDNPPRPRGGGDPVSDTVIEDRR